MLMDIALVLLSGLLVGQLCRLLRLPGLVGMLGAGILLGPSVLNLLSPAILQISGEIRLLALLVILIRAGLKLDFTDLKKVGRPALLMCFLPATCEIVGIWLLAPPLLGFASAEALVLGAVLAAVSPAVVVPRMVRLMDQGYGVKKGIPQMILAGSSADDVYVLVLFTGFLDMAKGGRFSWLALGAIPLSLGLGVLAGFLVGLALAYFFKTAASHKLPTLARALLLLSIGCLLYSLEQASWMPPFASLIAVITMGMVLADRSLEQADRLAGCFDRLWLPAEMFLFVLVGASVAIKDIQHVGFPALVLLVGGLLFRLVGVCLALLQTALNRREILFAMLAYLPKATVQAAIGGLPLAMGLAAGQSILAVSVIAILLTAPLGAFLTDRMAPLLLSKE